MGYVTLARRRGQSRRARRASSGAAAASSRQRIGADQIVLVTRELASLLNAGLALDRALEVLSGIAGDDSGARHADPHP